MADWSGEETDNALYAPRSPMIDLTQLTPAQLLQLHACIGGELFKRGIVRSENIAGDVAEYSYCLDSV
jgi:hypothetical protein